MRLAGRPRQGGFDPKGLIDQFLQMTRLFVDPPVVVISERKGGIPLPFKGQDEVAVQAGDGEVCLAYFVGVVHRALGSPSARRRFVGIVRHLRHRSLLPTRRYRLRSTHPTRLRSGGTTSGHGRSARARLYAPHTTSFAAVVRNVRASPSRHTQLERSGQVRERMQNLRYLV